MFKVECSIEHRELRIERSLETRDRPFDGLRASRACRGTLHEERALGLTVDAYIDNAASRMLKKSASGVLASLRGSTYRSVRLASLLAAALLDSLFEHPEVILALAPYGNFGHILASTEFFRSLLVRPIDSRSGSRDRA